METDIRAKTEKGEKAEALEVGLEELRLLALDLGASDAVVIPASEVIVDPRARLKCMIPKCYMSGNCHHCPPHGYTTQEVREIISRYEWAVFFRVLGKSSIFAAKSISHSINTGVLDNQGNVFNLGGHYILTSTIAKLLQKRAKSMGYAPTYGFAAGNCRDPFCLLQPTCQNLMSPQGCRNPELSCYSMESCGMDAFTMAARSGWDVYPIGGTCEPDSVPHGTLMGLVLVT
jgi:predicted metal-binding protein